MKSNKEEKTSKKQEVAKNGIPNVGSRGKSKNVEARNKSSAKAIH